MGISQFLLHLSATVSQLVLLTGKPLHQSSSSQNPIFLWNKKQQGFGQSKTLILFQFKKKKTTANSSKARKEDIHTKLWISLEIYMQIRESFENERPSFSFQLFIKFYSIIIGVENENLKSCSITLKTAMRLFQAVLLTILKEL